MDTSVFWLFLFVLCPIKLPSQHIEGQVFDQNGHPLLAVNVYCQNDHTIGTITDEDGNFNLEISGNNCDSLTVSYLGFQSISLATPSLGNKIDSIYLAPISSSLIQVEVKAAQNLPQEFTVMEMSQMDIYLNPSASADPLKAITTLPYSTNEDETANPALRGSAANRTKVYLNGLPIDRPVKNAQLDGVGFFSLFNTALLEKQFIYPSNPPLNFGNASAGIVELETATSTDYDNIQFSAGLANVGIQLTKGFSEKGLLQVYGNWNLSKPFLFVNQEALPQLKSFQARDIGINTAYQLSETTKVRFYSYFLDEGSATALSIFATIDTSKSKAQRNFNILNVKTTLEKGWISFVGGFDWRNSHFQFSNIQSKEREKQFFGAINWKYYINETFVLQTGITNFSNHFNTEFTRPIFYFANQNSAPVAEVTSNLRLTSPEAYVYLKIPILRRLKLGLGTRQSFLNDGVQNFTSFQVNLKYEIAPEHQLLAAAGRYHNIAHPTYFNPGFELLKSHQFSLDYQYRGDQSQIQAALFYKEEAAQTSPDRSIFGIELFWEQLLGKWFQFSLSNTFLSVNDTSEGLQYRAQNDFPYYAKFTINFQNNKILNIGCSGIIRPGSRYTEITGAQWHEIAQAYEPIYANTTFGKRFGNYQSINLQLSKSFEFGKQGLICYLNINNLLNQKNEREFWYNEDYSNAAPRYFAGRVWYTGMVWSIAK